MSEGRYVLPTFLERTSYGTKEMNPYNKLFEDRIIFLGAPIDETSANDVTAQLLALEAIDPDRDIRLYINSPGGSVTALMAIYDTMRYVRPEIETTCLGQAASAAAILLAAGTAGKRLALPHARIVLHQPELRQASRGQFSDLEIEAREVLRFRRVMEEILARHTGLPVDRVARDIERDNFLNADEAKEYGLVDAVLTTRKREETQERAQAAATAA